MPLVRFLLVISIFLQSVASWAGPAVYVRLPFADTLLCAGGPLNVTYGSDTFNSGNMFSVQISNPNGQFDYTGWIIGRTTATTAGVIACTIPAHTTAGNSYKIRVIASNPIDTSQPIPMNISIGRPISGITVGGSNGPVCEGDTLRLNASYSGIGPVTHYRWVGPNGFDTLQRNPTIAEATRLASGIYTVTAMNVGCASTPGTLTAIVKPAPDSATVTFNAPVCLGDTLRLFASSPTPGVIFAWQGPSFTDTGAYVYVPSIQLAHGGWYHAKAYLNGCPSLFAPSPTSGKVVAVYGTTTGPTVSVTASPGLISSAGTPVTFQATVVNGGAKPAYQWLKNGLAIPGETSASFISSTLSDNDAISVVIHSSEICAKPDSVVSSPLAVRVSTGVDNAFSRGDVRLYPCPNNGTFSLNGTLTTDEDAIIEVIDLTGKAVFKSSAAIKNRTINARISLGGTVCPGLYVLRIIQSGIQARTIFSVL